MSILFLRIVIFFMLIKRLGSRLGLLGNVLDVAVEDKIPVNVFYCLFLSIVVLTILQYMLQLLVFSLNSTKYRPCRSSEFM